jgi:hypothetical protein
MSSANPLWGTPRIVDELGKLGIEVAKSTVDKVPCSTSQAALADMEGVSEGSRHGLGVDRFLHRANDPVQGSLCPGRARTCSAQGDSLQRD